MSPNNSLSSAPIQNIEVLVEDLDMSHHFYADILGLKVAWLDRNNGDAGYAVGSTLLITDARPDKSAWARSACTSP